METQESKITKRDIEKIYSLISKREVLNLTNMTEMEKLILELHWGRKYSYQQIADALKLTRERIRQIYEQAIRRIIYTIRISNKRFNEFAQVLEQNKKLQTENDFLKKKLKLFAPKAFLDTFEENLEGNSSNNSNGLNSENNKSINFNIPISEIEFSVRTTNALTNGGVQTLEELMKYNKLELVKFPNLGKHSLGEIIYQLKSLGLELKV